MFGIGVLPEQVMNSVGTHLDHHEKVPVASGLEHMTRQPESPLGHVVDGLEDAIFLLLVGAKSDGIENVAAGHALNLIAKRRRIGELLFSRGRKKAGYHLTVHRLWRIGLRNSD